LIKPGFVDTPMTANFKKGALWPETVARGIYRAIKWRRNVIYLPWFWRLIMMVIRLIQYLVLGDEVLLGSVSIVSPYAGEVPSYINNLI